ncbi:hypothetical protein [Streptomyces sp. CS113]|uniref:hypothetical protein n=1 Tax=Streptomyces sp. CS113 TaxID=1982761 RepID=UPI00211AB5D1|nr:hypothetical protein [Streptomyces sp. CS113]
MSMTMRRLARAVTAGLVAAAALTAAARSAEAAGTPGFAAAGHERHFGTAVAANHLGEADRAATRDRVPLHLVPGATARERSAAGT